RRSGSEPARRESCWLPRLRAGEPRAARAPVHQDHLARARGHLMQHVHVRRGDTVAVISGRERGKRGKVLRVLPTGGRVLVEKINMMKKHQRPTQKLRQGGI